MKSDYLINIQNFIQFPKKPLRIMIIKIWIIKAIVSMIKGKGNKKNQDLRVLILKNTMIYQKFNIRIMEDRVNGANEEEKIII